MSATHLNPQLDQTAARYVAKAMGRVHPSQRLEVLRAMKLHIEAAEAVIVGSVQERKAA